MPGAPFNVVVNTAAGRAGAQRRRTAGATPSPASLNVSVSDADGDPLTVTYYGRPKTVAAPDFTLVTIPDTQHYVDNATLARNVHGADELDRRQPRRR